jgi:hypothetical protein
MDCGSDNCVIDPDNDKLMELVDIDQKEQEGNTNISQKDGIVECVHPHHM